MLHQRTAVQRCVIHVLQYVIGGGGISIRVLCFVCWGSGVVVRVLWFMYPGSCIAVRGLWFVNRGCVVKITLPLVHLFEPPCPLWGRITFR